MHTAAVVYLTRSLQHRRTSHTTISRLSRKVGKRKSQYSAKAMLEGDSSNAKPQGNSGSACAICFQHRHCQQCHHQHDGDCRRQHGRQPSAKFFHSAAVQRQCATDKSSNPKAKAVHAMFMHDKYAPINNTAISKAGTDDRHEQEPIHEEQPSYGGQSAR